jgi:transcription elongation GreA/GreB family factor
VTRRGLERIEAEVARLRAALAEAQVGADLDRIASVSRDLRYWSARQASAQLQPPPADCEMVRFGCTVTIERSDGRRQDFTIVGEDEAEPPAGTLSYASPLAHGLMGRQIGDVVRAGRDEAEILAIKAS